MLPMLNQERIPIGQLRQAYDLNSSEVRELLCVLWPDAVFPYQLWETAYLSFWKRAMEHNTIFFGAQFYTPFPELDPKEHETFSLVTFQNKILPFFEEITQKIFVSDLQNGLQLIIEETYGDVSAYIREMESLLSPFFIIESEFDLRIIPPYVWETKLNPDYFAELVEKKKNIESNTHSFIGTLFLDAILVSKSSAIRHLSACHYSLQKEIKGLSRSLVDHIVTNSHNSTAKNVPQIADEYHGIPCDIPSHTPPVPGTVFVPQSLWQGKQAVVIRDAMREKEYDDTIIAYALYTWKGLNNKTQLGKLLSEAEREDSSYRRLADRLLREAEALTITTS